jgi:hypothetical protein
VRRRWQTGDLLEVTLPMQLAVEPTPDHPAVQALTYGPVVLSGVYGRDPGQLTPQLELASVRRTAAQPMTFEAVADHKPVRLLPVARAAHEYYCAAAVGGNRDRRPRGHHRLRAARSPRQRHDIPARSALARDPPAAAHAG